MTKKVSYNQIISARLLLETAKMQVKKTGLEKAFSILHAHDALDWILQYLYDSSTTSKKGKLMFPDYVNAIAKRPENFGSLDTAKCDQLNTMRSNFKHNFVIPNDKQAEEIVLWVEMQIESLIKTYTSKPLSDFDTLNAIANEQVKEKIRSADRSIEDDKRVHAFADIAIAFAMLERLKRDQIKDISGIRLPSSESFTFSSSFFLRMDDNIFGWDFNRAWDKLIENVEYQNSTVSASLLGVEYAEYLSFLTYTPRPQRTRDGKYHVNVMPQYEEKSKDFDYDFCRELVISTAIKNGL